MIQRVGILADWAYGMGAGGGLLRRAALGVALGGALLLLGGRAQAADGGPVLQKIFVYAGDERIRLVALFDQALDVPAPSPKVGGEALSLFLPRARGGKALRHFEVGQGGYERVEAEESPKGLWLTVRGPKSLARAAQKLNLSVSGKALTLTLPALERAPGAGEPRPAETAARPAAPRPPLDGAGRLPSLRVAGKGETPKQAAPEPGVTPEAILNRVLSSREAEAAPAPPKGTFKEMPAFGPGTPGAPALSPSASDLGTGVVSFSGVALQVAAVLGALLALALGGLVFLKKLAPGAASRLGAGGKLVRTLHKTYLAPKQSIALVEVAGEVLVIGISGQTISMLTKIEDAAALARVRNGGEASFVDHLAKLMAGKGREAGGPAPGGREAAPKSLPEKAAPSLPAGAGPAILAYARGLASGAKAPLVEEPKEASASPAPGRPLPPAASGDGAQERNAGSGRAAARLRERLGRLSPQLAGSGLAP